MGLSQFAFSPTGLTALSAVAVLVAVFLRELWRQRSLILHVRRLGKVCAPSPKPAQFHHVTSFLTSTSSYLYASPCRRGTWHWACC